MRSDQVIIHLIDPTRIREIHTHLTAEETERASRFRSHKDSTHWAACRAGLRIALAKACAINPKDVPISVGPNGKPLLDPPFTHVHFNLSHCSDLALVAIAGTPVGIDIERSDRGPDLLGCEETFCHAGERMALPAEREPRSMFLLDIWTAKESVLKALGTGFFLPPEEVEIRFDTTPVTALSPHRPTLSQNLHIHRLGHPALADHTAFVSTSPRVIEILFNTDFI